MRFHKGAAYAIIAVLFSIFGPRATAQQSVPSHRIRAVIENLRNARQAHDVDLDLRAIPGVRMSRTDYNTRNVLMEVSADCAIDREQVEAILLARGLSLNCWSRNPQGTHDLEPLDPRSCGELHVER